MPRARSFDDYEVSQDLSVLRTMLVNGRRVDHLEVVVLGIRDITESKRIEVALRENAERQGFLLNLADALRPLSDPIEIQAKAARLLGEQLRSGRAYYVEVDEKTAKYVVARDWHQPGETSHARCYRLVEWPTPWLTNDRTLVVRDTATDPALPDNQPGAYRSIGVGALIIVPLVKGGRLVV